MESNEPLTSNPAYRCWLNYDIYRRGADPSIASFGAAIVTADDTCVMRTAASELKRMFRSVYGIASCVTDVAPQTPHIRLTVSGGRRSAGDDFAVTVESDRIKIEGVNPRSVLYGVFYLITSIGAGRSLSELPVRRQSQNQLRIIEHWDNISGEIERGYAGRSLFYDRGQVGRSPARVRDYARLLASVGVNCLVLNNVNVWEQETRLISDEYLSALASLAVVFADYGIRVLLSVNFAAPIQLGGLGTADPADESVRAWWNRTADRIYAHIPDFGGFLVKADSESRPGPYTYGRDHAQGANMLADALAPHGGLLIWRCFVYNCHMDWRDRKLDRARAAYDTFVPLDGKFHDNVVLQIKNGPMDFQIREPVAPLFGGMTRTNQMMEFQITQEYTGQQIDLCYLVPLWKEALDFDTCVRGKGSFVRDVVSGRLFHNRIGGIAGVSNVGDSPAWTGHPLAQANLFGFGRIAWDPTLPADAIATEWARLTFGNDPTVTNTVSAMLMRSRGIYESYTSPLGIGWFVNPQYHYGPNVDGYEYSRWGTYHYADFRGIGVDRTVATGTGYAGQYCPPNDAMYENADTCPENLLLFFHHVPYDHVLSSGQTVLQYIYDTHFEGAEQAAGLLRAWDSLQGRIAPEIFQEGRRRFSLQTRNAVEWRDVVNTYFYRKTGVPDAKGRQIYP